MMRKCPLCGKRFWSRSGRLGHVIMDHNPELRRRLDAALKAFSEPPPETVELVK